MTSVLAASPGERLRTLRELMGLTQAQVSSMSGVASSWISDVENGYRDHDDAKLELIAKATETPIGFFYVQPMAVPLDSLRFRKLASAKRTVTKRVHALYSESYRVSDDLITSERYPTPPLPFTDADEVTSEEIEELADQTRIALRLAPDKPIPHLTRALERGGIAVAPMVLTDQSGDEPSGNDHFGVSYWSGLGDTALIGYFPASGDRDRFTLAHELGHLVLHTFRPRAKDAEAEANRFASALLMPRERAQEDLSPRMTLTEYARMKATWGISIQALIMRASAVGRIDETRKRSLYVQLSQRNWRKQEPVEVGQETPLLLWTLLERRFGPKPYVPGADHLAIPPAVLRSIAPTPKAPSDRRPSRSPQPESATGESRVVQFKRRGDGPTTGPTRLAR
ncbi:XRE family transcriptional regulator [Streptomyces sp. NPDC088190]|uniref:XRE family transcriptional regulator n=1 Tax=unclassified Streptomyces TaxID=2593676 RepID=UPI002E7A5D89|nr:XRE family transcriptional regulator [Streptomyces sp. JV190]MEE1844158.1 XRE family transcriptional regulator [Streptomyces sp. JV190]